MLRTREHLNNCPILAPDGIGRSLSLRRRPAARAARPPRAASSPSRVWSSVPMPPAAARVSRS
eukprot:5447789-Pyramimonas_sp.AAC.1